MNFKFIASGAGFAGLGAVVAWAITADLAEQRSQKMAEDFLEMSDLLREKTRENIALRYDCNDKQEEIDNLQGAIDVHTGFSEDENSPGETVDETVSTPEVEEEHVYPDDPSEEELETDRQALRDLIADYTPNEQLQREFVEQATPVVASTKYDPPFVISEDDYANDDEGSGYAKITFKYYPAQQTLLDEEEEPVDDVDAYVGWRSLRRFGEMTTNADVVYVRNRRLETDFEVEKTDENLPLHVIHAMPKIEFLSQKAAGKILLREEDE